MPLDPADPAQWPVWCCAILRDSRGRFVFERRPVDEPDAPGMLTCFGGTREPGEDPEACLRRELLEELGFIAGEIELCVELTTPKGIAWFYRAHGPDEGMATALEPGFGIEWIAAETIGHAGIGAWNLAAIRAELRGERQARSD